MKKSSLFVVFIILALAIAGYLYALNAPKQAASTASSPDKAGFERVSQFVRDKCMACHTKDLDLPFYASIPGIKQII